MCTSSYRKRTSKIFIIEKQERKKQLSGYKQYYIEVNIRKRTTLVATREAVVEARVPAVASATCCNQSESDVVGRGISRR